MQKKFEASALVLVLAILLVIIVVLYCLKMSSGRYTKAIAKVPAAILATTKTNTTQARFNPKAFDQTIQFTADDKCWISRFVYGDTRSETDRVLMGINVNPPNANVTKSKEVTLGRRYLGDAVITFKLTGAPGNIGNCKVNNNVKKRSNGKKNFPTEFSVKFGNKGFVDVIIFLSKTKITTIYSYSPKPITLYQSKESTKT